MKHPATPVQAKQDELTVFSGRGSQCYVGLFIAMVIYIHMLEIIIERVVIV